MTEQIKNRRKALVRNRVEVNLGNVEFVEYFAAHVAIQANKRKINNMEMTSLMSADEVLKKSIYRNAKVDFYTYSNEALKDG